MIAHVTPKQMMWLLESFDHPRGPGGVIEDIETGRGATIIPLGSREPFHFDPADWERGVISRLGDEVRIVAVEARRPRHGALKRLVANIQAAGLKPVIVAAMLDMPAILKHWGWIRKDVPDVEGGTYDEWRPRDGDR